MMVTVCSTVQDLHPKGGSTITCGSCKERPCSRGDTCGKSLDRGVGNDILPCTAGVARLTFGGTALCFTFGGTANWNLLVDGSARSVQEDKLGENAVRGDDKAVLGVLEPFVRSSYVVEDEVEDSASVPSFGGCAPRDSLINISSIPPSLCDGETCHFDKVSENP